MISLSPAQQQVVSHRGADLQVIACAGSGKTESISRRVAALLSREYRTLDLGKLGARHWQPIGDFAKALDVLGNELIPPANLQGTPLGDRVRAYRDTLDRYHFLTYAMLISAAVEALEDPAVHARVHASLRHLMVDEYQDIHPAQLAETVRADGRIPSTQELRALVDRAGTEGGPWQPSARMASRSH